MCYLELLEELFKIIIDFDFNVNEIVFNMKIHLPTQLELFKNVFGSNHAPLRSGLLNHHTSIPLNMCRLSSNNI
jgi:hypothetical protein